MSASYVIHRGHAYYFRLRLPEWLAPHVGRTYHMQTLNTSDATVAAGLAAAAAIYWKTKLQEF